MFTDGQQFNSTGFMSGILQRSPQEITAALQTLRIQPAYVQNGVSYYHASCLPELRAHFRENT